MTKGRNQQVDTTREVEFIAEVPKSMVGDRDGREAVTLRRGLRWGEAAMAVAVVVLAVAMGTTAEAGRLRLPSSMAGAGDSITRAFDVGFCCILRDSPQYSWSTGSSSAVNSHYLRLLSRNQKIAGRAANVAQTGAKMADLGGQLAVAAGQRVDYVTILMGANDLCTSSAATMTPTPDFESQFRGALTKFFTADPSARVFVSSIPDLYQLWSTLRGNVLARLTWDTFDICPSMLSSANTEDDRQAVVARERADNTVLATVCMSFSNCRWDGGATYNFVFSSAMVSSVDYFHPSIAGQAALASVSWAASYWPDS
jgi:lysophospholipase L1-like esterase